MPTRPPRRAPQRGPAAPYDQHGYDQQAGDRTQRMPAGGRPVAAAAGPVEDDGRGAYPPGGPAGPGGPGGPREPGGPGGPRQPRGPEPVAAPRPRRRRRWTKWLAAFLVILLLWVGAIAWAGHAVWGKVAKVDAIPTGERPAEGKGTNIVLVGSDSREGLTTEQKRDLGTGSAAGRRTDSIMLLHMPESGDPTLVSLPRDSYVKIPGHRRNKINAAFSVGGPQLLVQTVEGATGMHVDGYMEIGFGGFASVVDSVGGVRMCLPKAMKDEKAHIDLPAGCQNLDGKNALGYVRARYFDPLGDLGRAKRQREFLGALMKKMASPGNVINPFKLKSMGASGAQGVAVDKDMSPWGALKVMLALKNLSGGKGQSIQVPVADNNYSTPAGSAVKWDADKATALFDALNKDQSPNVAP
ncbi:LCP family protein [Luteipulveratus flavus]|uniref:LCP family protein n=1 Tax=Luteipulveratus flavus TaxID=3031728 RepID=A0ABT6C2R5_9MICO|nr:LCP family protein [Luteipulveratus sp. YIM 133296]MDF8262980.1 LCP family protein [Luteipulveratus sp. YIM 133296]